MRRPLRVMGYARVSSAEQALGTSLRDQQATIEAYAKDRGLMVTRMYVESVSAIHEKIESRMQMQALMCDMRTGDLVLCAKLDRWSRDAEFAYGSVRKILAAGAACYFIDERCDPSTPEGDTMLGFRILFAREEHKRIKERLVGTRVLLRAGGYYVEGTPPYGYRRQAGGGSDRLAKNILVIEPTEAALVRRMFRMSGSGKSIAEIASSLGLGRKRVWSSLRCRSYLGELRTKDGWIKGRHEAIVPAELFARVVETLSARRHGGPRPRSTPARTDGWILRDVAHCAHCGARMGAAYGNDPAVNHYYRCSAKCRARGPRVPTGSYVGVAAVEAAFEPLVLARLAELREEISRGSEPPPAAPVSFDDRRSKLQRKRARYLESFADDLMSKAELRAALAKTDEELVRIDDEEAAQPVRLGATARREMLRELGFLETAWRKAPARDRRQLVNVLVSRVDIAAGQPPIPTWRPKEAISSGEY